MITVKLRIGDCRPNLVSMTAEKLADWIIADLCRVDAFWHGFNEGLDPKDQIWPDAAQPNVGDLGAF